LAGKAARATVRQQLAPMCFGDDSCPNRGFAPREIDPNQSQTAAQRPNIGSTIIVEAF
jgi:hypothetical protein